MELLTDDRAQALQVGAVLLFGILVILFAVWQAFVIPDQNERVEFNHNQQVQSEMVELRGDIVSTADATTPTSSSVELGTRFPTRLLFVNPSPAAGTLRAVDVGEEEFVLRNAAAADEDSGERLFWDGSDREYDTRSLEYSPDYRVFQGAPDTVYDNTVTYNVFRGADEGTSALSEQAIINDDTITLISFVGEYSEGGVGSVTADIQPVSTQGPSIPIENDTTGNITIELSTKLNETQWGELLDEEDNVVNVTDGGEDVVEIELAEGQYELQLAQVGVGKGLTGTPPAYIAPVDGFDDPLPPSGNQTFTVEVRDRFNGAVSDVALESEVEDGDSEFVEDFDVTDTDGLASFTLNISEDDQDEEIDLLFSRGPEQSWDGDAADDDLDEFRTTLNVTDPVTAGEEEALGLRWEDVEFTGAGVSCDQDDEQGTFACTGIPPGQDIESVTINATGTDAEAGDVVQLVNTNTEFGEFQEEGGGDRIFFTQLQEDGDDLVSQIAVETDGTPSSGDTTTFVGHIPDDVAVLVLEWQ